MHKQDSDALRAWRRYERLYAEALARREGSMGPHDIPGAWSVDQVKRRAEFEACHPEWTITFVRSMGYYEGTRDDPNTVITDYDLRHFLDKLERATPGKM